MKKSLRIENLFCSCTKLYDHGNKQTKYSKSSRNFILLSQKDEKKVSL